MYSSLDFGLLLALPRRLVAIPQRRSRMLRMLFRLSIDIPDSVQVQVIPEQS